MSLYYESGPRNLSCTKNLNSWLNGHLSSQQICALRGTLSLPLNSRSAVVVSLRCWWCQCARWRWEVHGAGAPGVRLFEPQKGSPSLKTYINRSGSRSSLLEGVISPRRKYRRWSPGQSRASATDETKLGYPLGNEDPGPRISPPTVWAIRNPALLRAPSRYPPLSHSPNASLYHRCLR